MPNSNPSLVNTAIALILVSFSGVVLVGPLIWYLVIRRVQRKEPILEHEPRRLAPWGFIDLLLAFVLVFGLIVVGFVAARVFLGAQFFAGRTDADPKVQMVAMLISGLAQIAACTTVGAFILLRTRCSLQDLGVSFANLLSDIRLGAAAFCALAIPTYGLQILLTQFWKSEHPLIEALKKEPDLPFLGIAMFAAVISAPLTEEFAFRVLFQGWLEKMFDAQSHRRPNFFANLVVGERVPSEPEAIQAELAYPGQEMPVVEQVIATEPSSNPYHSPPYAEAMVPSPSATAEPFPGGFPVWFTDVFPIGISAGIFALLHASHGPDWIPLFGLAVGLGYLYRRTHRIVPGLVVHFLLNLTSMLLLCVSIYQPTP